MTRILITNKATGEQCEISRNVSVEHPQWVHDQCGTTSESELQACLDQFSVDDWYRGDTHLGQDISGLEMFRG